MSKKVKKEWLHVGNFLLGVEKHSMGSRVVCKSQAGNWQISWRDDTMMFQLMINLMKNENSHEYLHALVAIMFTVSTYPHDLVSVSERGTMPVMEGIAALIADQTKYELSLKPEATQEENDKALEEVGEMTEIQEELENLDKADGN
jgi:hypothetical protein